MIERRRHHPAATSSKEAASSRNNHSVSSSSSPSKSRSRRRQKQPSLGIWSSRALLLGVAAIYSTNFATVKYLENFVLVPNNIDNQQYPSKTTFCRFLVSLTVALPILIILAVFGKHDKHNRNISNYIPIFLAGLECGLWMSVNYVTQAQALQSIEAGKCAFLAALTVVTVPLFGRLFFGHQPLSTIRIVSALVALLGVAILENVCWPVFGGAVDTTSTLSTDGSVWWFGLKGGDVWALGQPVGFGYGVLRIQHHIARFSHIPHRVLILTCAQCVGVCMISLVWFLYDCRGTGVIPDLTDMLERHHVVALVWTGIVTTVVAIVLQGLALQTASATDASLIFSTEPVWGSLFAAWLLNERLTATTYIGGAFILAACVLGSLADAESEGSTLDSAKQRSIKKKSSSISLAEDSLLPLTSDSNTSLSSLGDVPSRSPAKSHS